MVVDGRKGHRAIEAKLEAALVILAGDVVAVLVFKEGGYTLWAVPQLLILDGCDDLNEVCNITYRLTLSVMVRSLAELADLGGTGLAHPVLVAIEVVSVPTLRAQHRTLEDDFVGQLVKVLEVHLPFEFLLGDQPLTVLLGALEVFQPPSPLLYEAGEISEDTLLAESVAAAVEAKWRLLCLEAHLTGGVGQLFGVGHVNISVLVRWIRMLFKGMYKRIYLFLVNSS